METITLFENPIDCTGCGACAVACPRDAIVLQPDAVGAVYPRIRQELCVGCKKCLHSCPQSAFAGSLPEHVYAGAAKEPQEHSASGGIFAVLAQTWLAQGGLVAGAVMEGEKVYHLLGSTPEELVRMQGSKYTQSDTRECFRQVQAALKQGKAVLFSGTPCQVAAIKRLTGDPEELTTVDVICHGVPPTAMFRDFLELLGKRFGGPVKDFSFRDKSSKKPFTARFTVKNRIYRLRPRFLSYYQYFLEGVTYRENCYHCAYAQKQRASDITLGDYWGVEQYHADELPPRQDWSCILVNTPKGSRLLESCKESLLLYPSRLEWVARHNGQLNEPSRKPTVRQQVLTAYSRGGYRAVETLFIRQQGGKLRFFLRLQKQIMSKGKHL